MAGDARTSPRALLQAGDWPAARRACERALAAAGPEAGARLAREGLVRALLELGEAPLALEAVDAGLAGAASGQGAGWGGPAPWHTGQKLKVEALLAIGEYGEAAALAAALEGALPNPSAARRALQAVRERVERAAGAAATEKLRGNAAFRSGDMADAAMHYRTALRRDDGEVRTADDRAAVHSNLAAALCESARTTEKEAERRIRAEEALKHADAAVNLRPNWGRGHARRGSAHLRLGNAREAEAAFRRALMFDSDNGEAKTGLAYCTRGRTAAPAPSAAPERAPAAPAPARKPAAPARKPAAPVAPSTDPKEQGDAMYRQGDYALAAHFYTQAIAKDKGNHVLYSNRSAAYTQGKEYQKAVADAQHVVKLKPTWPKGYSRLGSALYGLRHLQAAYCAYCRGLVNCPSSRDLQEGRVRVLRDLPRIDYKIGNWREYPLFLKDAAMPNTETRVFCCSDLHVDQNGNIGWCKMLSTTAFRNDVLIVAGDVGDTMNALRHAFRALRPKFRRVFFCPGNHELWLRPGIEDKTYPDSICKLAAMDSMLEEMGVEMTPGQVADGLFVVPLYSWYNCAWDESDPRPGRLRHDSFCRFPIKESEVWDYFLRLNGTRTAMRLKRRPDDRVFTFSHFLPRADLSVPWGVPEISKGVGCKELDLQVQALQADVHVFGHTHLNTDTTCSNQYEERGGVLTPGSRRNDCRYVQSALAGGGGLYCLWDRGHVSGKMVDVDGRTTGAMG